MVNKKHAFQWSKHAELALDKLKLAMFTTPGLSLPNYNKVFVLECEASGKGTGAALMHEDSPLLSSARLLVLKI